jgi:transcriptional regulator with XRE-family HTH domain
MNQRESKTPRMFLAREIQRAREAKGMTRDDLAKAVFVSESLVRMWERGKRIPQPDHLKAVEVELGTGGILGRIREDLVNTAVPIEWFGRWPEIENRATEIWTFQPLLVPGLLQTAGYTTEVLRAQNLNADLKEMVDARIERQGILTKDHAPLYVALISESVLRHKIGDQTVMMDQMVHLVSMAELENVIVHVVLNDSPVCAGFSGGFVVANFDGGDDVTYLDNAIAGEVNEDAESVARLRRVFNLFRAEALRAGESIEFIYRQSEELWK